MKMLRLFFALVLIGISAPAFCQDADTVAGVSRDTCDFELLVSDTSLYGRQARVASYKVAGIRNRSWDLLRQTFHPDESIQVNAIWLRNRFSPLCGDKDYRLVRVDVMRSEFAGLVRVIFHFEERKSVRLVPSDD